MTDHEDSNIRCWMESGNVKDNDPMVRFLYILMRDHLPVGQVEQIMVEHIEKPPKDDVVFCNGWLANYAQYTAKRIREGGNDVTD